MSPEEISKRINHAQALIDIKRPERAIEKLVTIPQDDPEVSARVNCLLATLTSLTASLRRPTRALDEPSKPPPTTSVPCTG